MQMSVFLNRKRRKNEMKKGGDVAEGHHIHELLPHDHYRRNCSICKRQVKFYCHTCSKLKSTIDDEQSDDDEENIIWLCSPLPSNKGLDGHISRQCYTTHVIQSLKK